MTLKARTSGNTASISIAAATPLLTDGKSLSPALPEPFRVTISD